MTEGGDESPLSVAAGNTTEGEGEGGKNEGDIRGWVYMTFGLGSDS